jgi:alpha-1,6-mannosyltransferase
LSAYSLKRLIDVLGATAVIAYCATSLLSYMQAPALWPPSFSSHATAFFAQLYGQDHLNAMRAFFGGPFGVLVCRWVPLAMVSLAAIMLIFIVGRNTHGRDDVIAKRILIWSLVFVGANVFAYPVLTQDFWLSAIWGDMAASGINPYYNKFTPEMLGGLPLDHFPMTMSYGPLWALISGAVMAVSGGSILATALLFKAILAAAWCGTLLLVSRIMGHIAPASRSVALLIVGWVPLGVVETVAEGHNDIALILPALLWISLLLRKKITAPIALAGSVLCKYTTAPLFLIDFLHSLRGERATIRDYAVRLILPVLISMAIFTAFFRSFAFFDGMLLVGSWHFMQPADAFMALGRVTGDWIEPLSYLPTAFFPALAAYQCVQYWQTPEIHQTLRWALAIMCAVTFSLISHIWPWYLVWTLPLAALIPTWWLSRFIIGLALVSPFTAVVWWVPEAEGYKDLAALMMYSAAILWTLATSSRRTETEDAEMRYSKVPTVDFAQAREKAALWTASRRFEGECQPDMQFRAKASGENQSR